MSYNRVIPRDLFNEANLLKCYGQLYILLERLHGHHAAFSAEDLDSFDITQSPADGSITIENLLLIVGAENYRLRRPLNSREPWPLYAEKTDDDDFDVVLVFDDDGQLSADMRTRILGL